MEKTKVYEVQSSNQLMNLIQRNMINPILHPSLMQTNYIILLRNGSYEIQTLNLLSAINITFIGDMAGEKPAIQLTSMGIMCFTNTFINLHPEPSL